MASVVCCLRDKCTDPEKNPSAKKVGFICLLTAKDTWPEVLCEISKKL